MKNILVVAVHPDDETLGCGGTLLKHRQKGDAIYWCIVTSLQESQGYSQKSITRRDREIEKVTEKFSFNGVEQLGFSTTQLDQVPMTALISSLNSIIKKIEPHTVYLPFKEDVHSDHRITFQAAFSCCKTFRSPFVKRILMMETVSETEFCPAIAAESFVPNVFSDITDFIEQKMNIAKIYSDEMGNHPFPRSEKNIRALATLRGATANCSWAESFMLLKEIQ